MYKFKKNLFILLDGTYYLYRSYYAFPNLVNSYNKPTGAIYGFLHIINKFLSKYDTKHISLIFDSKKKTFRNQLFKHYKSKRSPMPINLRKQILPTYNIINTMGIPKIIIPGIEADDIIGTIASQAEKNGFFVLIGTADKDMAQLVTNNINIIDIFNNTILDSTAIKNKYGVDPNLIVDFLSLTGDNSDNIPGIPGIGKKTALFLIKKIGNLKTIYENITQISSLKYRGTNTLLNKLIKYKETAFLSYKLAAIQKNIISSIDCNSLIIKKPNIKKLYKIFNYYNFTYWLKFLHQNNWLTK